MSNIDPNFHLQGQHNQESHGNWAIEVIDTNPPVHGRASLFKDDPAGAAKLHVNSGWSKSSNKPIPVADRGRIVRGSGANEEWLDPKRINHTIERAIRYDVHDYLFSDDGTRGKFYDILNSDPPLFTIKPKIGENPVSIYKLPDTNAFRLGVVVSKKYGNVSSLMLTDSKGRYLDEAEAREAVAKWKRSQTPGYKPKTRITYDGT